MGNRTILIEEKVLREISESLLALGFPEPHDVGQMSEALREWAGRRGSTVPAEGSTLVTEILDRAKQTHLDREALYGADGHDRLGALLAVIFPEGLLLRTAEEFARFHLFQITLAKFNRYGAQYTAGGHADSAHDAGVYSFLLEAYDATHRADHRG